jgi:hypothetical protein
VIRMSLTLCREDEQIIPGFAGYSLNAAQERRKEVPADFSQDQADGFRAAAGQAPSGGVWLVVELLYGLEDARRGLFADQVRAVDYPAHGSDRDAGTRGDVSDGWKVGFRYPDHVLPIYLQGSKTPRVVISISIHFGI